MMAINLEKGQKINLQKADGSSLQQIFLGVGWDVAKSKGFLGFGGGSADIDLDASVILLRINKLSMLSILGNYAVRMAVLPILAIISQVRVRAMMKSFV